MENFDTNELIEQYLSGTLPTADKEAVEARIATDPAFRADVELHRQLHAEFEDPKKLQLRDLMREITETPPPPTNRFAKFKRPGILLLALLLGWVGLVWLARAPEPAPATPTKEEIKPIPPTTNEPIATQDTQTTPTEPQDKKPERQIAMANPADFAINRAFDEHLGSSTRATNGAADLKSPRLGADFTPENGRVKINFQGTAVASSDPAQSPLVLKIFNNQPNAEPIFNLSPVISSQSRATNEWAFSLSPKLRLKPGLYYFTIERQEDGDLIYIGKFTVGAK
jgi:hypothetical protein